MGKITKQRNRKTVSPTRLLQNENTTNEESLINTPNYITLLNNLDSSKESERHASISALSTIFENSTETSITKIINNKIIKKLFARLSDTVPEIRLLTCGILKNLTIKGGPTICNYLVKEDILTILLHIFDETQKEIGKIKGFMNKKNEYCINVNVLKEIVELISFLCEGSEVGCNVVSNYQNVVVVFMNNFKLFLPGSFENNVILENTIEALNVISDENEVFAQKFLNFPNSVNFFVNLFKNNNYSCFFKVNCASMLFNVKSDNNIIKLISDFLLFCLKFDPIEELLKNFEKFSNPNFPNKQNWFLYTKTQKMALEVLTNIISCLSMCFSNNEQNFVNKVSVNFVSQKNVIPFLVGNFKNLTKQINNVIVNSKSFQKELKLIYTTLLRNCSCINNLVLSCPVEILNKFGIGGIWNNIITLSLFFFNFYKNNNYEQSESLDTLLSLLMVLCKKDKLNIAVSFKQSTFFVELTKYPLSETVRQNSVGILLKFAQHTNEIEKIKSFTNLFVLKLSDASIFVVLEAFNSIIDIYRNKKYDKIFFELKMLQKMQIFEKMFIQKFPMTQFDIEMQMEINNDLLNLRNFIKFKQNSMKFFK